MGWNRTIKYPVLVGISVIDRPLTTERCIKQLLKMTNRKDITIVAIDNNSNAQTKDVLEKYKKDLDVIIHNDFNIGCVFTINQYMSYRKPGQHIINVNVDAHIIVDNWLPMMLKVLNWQDIGTVGGRRPTLWFDKDDGGERGADRLEVYKKHVIVYRREGIYIENVGNLVIGPWWMIKSSVIETIGYMNESTNIDDIDYIVRVPPLGLQNVYIPDVVILQPQDELQLHPEYTANRALVVKHWERHLKLIANYNRDNSYCGNRFIPGSITDPTYQEMSDENWLFFKNRSKCGVE